MNEHRDETDPATLDLTDRLPPEIAPPKDLWPAIEVAIGREANEADRLLQRLPREIAPPDEVWSQVVGGISSRKSRKPGGSTGLWHALPRLAASIAFVGVVGALLLQSGMLDDAVDPARDQVTAWSAEDWLASGLWNFGLDSPTETAAPFEETRRTFLEQLAAVRRQREEIEASLALYPEQPALQELWIHVYETELLLIDEAGRVLTIIQTGWHS
jgi:hypothetical protein